jgi:formiminotetrahydrofolate cyclodeaminase
MEEGLMKKAIREKLLGGGAASALAGALAAGLVIKVSLFTLKKKKSLALAENFKKIRQKALGLKRCLFKLADEDSRAFKAFLANKEDQKVLAGIVETPLQVAKSALKVFKLASFLAEKGSQEMVADSRVGMELATASFYGALEVVRGNLFLIKEAKFGKKVREEIETLLNKMGGLRS